MIKQAVILCGGKGIRLNDGLRYSPAVEVPKPLIEVGGKPFVTYAINMLKGVGITKVFLLVLHKMELFEQLKNVELVKSQSDINKVILDISGLDDRFLLLNGDCFPVMDWRDFINTNKDRVAVKIVGRDAGIAIVSEASISAGTVSCANIADMVGHCSTYTILGGLHIGTPQGLQRARLFMDTVVFGQ